MNQPATPNTIIYHVRLANPGAHLFEVSCRIGSPVDTGQVFSLPAWIPGSYLIRDFARHVVRVEAECGGVSVPIHKVDKHTWRAAPVTGELVCTATVYAADRSVRGAWLDFRSAFFNGVSLFFRAHGRDDLPCVVHLDPPDTPAGADWRVATSLQRLTGTRYGWGAFRADDYADLIDHPVMMGELQTLEFEASKVPHVLAIDGRHQADLTRLRQDLRRLCDWHIDFFGSPPPMDRYWFLLHATADGYGGLEHRFSSALIACRDDLPAPGQAGVDAGYRRFLGLVSHEYFHLWLIKRIRPVEFVGADLSREAYTRQLWIFEGITSYYDDLALLRSGLITPESYLELLGKSLTRLYRTAGRRHQTLEEASFDTWIKFYRPDENSPNATVSYYLKGALVALALDLEIRLRSNGNRSLDDVMRALWREYGGADSAGLADGAFARLARETTGVDLDAFFRQCLQSTVDPPFGVLLSQFGIRLGLRPRECASDAGGRPGRRERRPEAWLGMKTSTASGVVRVASVTEEGPAQKAGIAAGDELLAIAGRRLGAASVGTMLTRLEPGQRVVVHLARDDELVVVDVEPTSPPRDTCFLAPDPDAAAAAVSRRLGWLGPAGPTEAGGPPGGE